MEKRRFKVEQFFEAPTCECGGIFLERTSNLDFESDPPQAEFKCRSCGKVRSFFEQDFPGVKTIVLFDEGEDIYGKG